MFVKSYLATDLKKRFYFRTPPAARSPRCAALNASTYTNRPTCVDDLFLFLEKLEWKCKGESCLRRLSPTCRCKRKWILWRSISPVDVTWREFWSAKGDGINKTRTPRVAEKRVYGTMLHCAGGGQNIVTVARRDCTSAKRDPVNIPWLQMACVRENRKRNLKACEWQT